MSVRGLTMTYEPLHHLYYIEVYPSSKSGGFGRPKSSLNTTTISNIAIYEVLENRTTYLFEEDPHRVILTYLFEIEYLKESQSIRLNQQAYYCINNQKIKPRVPSNKLWVVVQNNTKLEFWQANKQGQNLKLVRTISEKTSWKVDILNQKIIFVQSLPNAVEIQAIDY